MDWISKAVQSVAELPDRNSPTDWPDAMLVTQEELCNVLERQRTAPRTVDEADAVAFYMHNPSAALVDLRKRLSPNAEITGGETVRVD